MAYFPPTGSTVTYQITPSSNLGGASIFGQLPGGTAILGSVATLQGTNPWITTFSNSSIITSPTGNQSVSGTVLVNNGSVVAYQLLPSSLLTGASIFGQLPAGTAVLGSVAALQGTSPWNIAGSVAATIQGTPNINTAGSVVAFQGGSWTPSVSGTVGASIIGLSPVRISDGTNLLQIYEENNIDTSVVGIAPMFRSNANTSILSVVSPTTPFPVIGSVSGTIGASIIGQLPAGTAPLGSIATLQGTNPWITNFANSSILAGQTGTRVSSLVSIIPSSVIVGTSIFGQLPAGTALLGSVATLQGTNPWVVVGSVYQGIGWSGSVAATITNTNLNVGGSVVSQQLGTWTTSVVGSIPSSLLTGNYGFRNDAVASFLGGNLTWRQIATDSAGRILSKPFSSEDGTIISYNGSVVSASVTLIRGSTIGLRNYVTDFLVTNTGSIAQLITFQDGSTSVLGYTIVPAGGGSNAIGWNIPMKTALSQDLAFLTTGTSSVVYMTIKGYQAP